MVDNQGKTDGWMVARCIPKGIWGEGGEWGEGREKLTAGWVGGGVRGKSGAGDKTVMISKHDLWFCNFK